MVDFLRPLGLVALLALAAPAVAQDTATPAEAPAADAPAAAAPATDAPALDMGTNASQPETYVAEVFDDWHRECVRAPDGAENCYIAQLLRKTADAKETIGKVSMRRLPEGNEAAAYGEVIMPLGVVLPEHLTIQVDTSAPKIYDFRFCLPVGCVARLGFTAAETAAFKAGKAATITVAAESLPGQPPTKVVVPMSLKGFTKAYQSLEVPAAPPAPAAAAQ